MDDSRVGHDRQNKPVPTALDSGALGRERKLYLREMVARFYDVFNGDTDITDLSVHEQTYYNCLSPGPSDDWSSDDEMRTDTKKNLKSVNRLLAEKHTS